MSFDVIDRQILATLREQGRASHAALAKEVGLSAPAVGERIRKLEGAGVITGYQATFSPDALGLGIWALAKKNGADAAIALVSLAVAPLTPFLSAGVLLVSPVIRRTVARSAGTPDLQPAE